MFGQKSDNIFLIFGQKLLIISSNTNVWSKIPVELRALVNVNHSVGRRFPMPYRVVKEALEKNQWRECYIVNSFFLGWWTGTNSQSSTSIVLPWIQSKLGNQCLWNRITLPWESSPWPSPIRWVLVTMVVSVGLKSFSQVYFGHNPDIQYFISQIKDFMANPIQSFHWLFEKNGKVSKHKYQFKPRIRFGKI